MKIKCILCESTDVVETKKVNVEQLKAVYSIANINISSDVKGLKVILLFHCIECKCSFFSPSNHGTQEFYEQLQGMPWYYPEEKSEFEFAKNYIKDDDSVLEIGCGAGSFGKYVNQEQYVGLEYTERAVQMARSKGLKVHNESIEVYSRKNKNLFDVVCFYQVLEHVEHPRDFLRCAIECVKPGGLLVVSVPSDDSFLALSVNNILNMPPHHITRWSDQALRNLTKLLNVELVCIHHELLSDVHLQGYLQTIVLRMLSSKYRVETPLLDMSFSYKLKVKAGQFLIKLLSPVFQSRFLRPYGHSVTAIYRVAKH